MSKCEEDLPLGPRLSKRPFADILDDLVNKVRAHLEELTGPVSDDPRTLDGDAAAVVPSSGPSAANCAAVWKQPSKRYLVAWNSVETGMADEHFGSGKWDYVKDASTIKHAEIKLIESNQGAELRKEISPYIGISKPCCLPCAAVMRIEGIGTRGRHADKNTNWDFPNAYKKDMGKMKLFLGPKAHEIMASRARKPTDDMPYDRNEIDELMRVLAQKL